MIQTGHTELYEELINIHKELVHRENASSVTIGQCARLGQDYFNSLAAGLLTLGNRHAPLVKTYEFLQRGAGAAKLADFFIRKKMTIPGWGSAFIKGEKDPSFDKIDDMLSNYRIHEHIHSVSATLHENDVMLWPNAACYTAAVAIELGVPKEVSPYLLIQGRLDGWTEIYYQNFVGWEGDD